MPRQKMTIDRWWDTSKGNLAPDVYIASGGLPGDNVNISADDLLWVSAPGIMATGVVSEDDARRIVEAMHRLSLPDMHELIQAHKRFIAATTPMGHDSAMEEGLNS